MITADQLPPRLGPNDPRGPLTFTAPLPGALQDLEDSTQSADFDRAWTLGRRFQRPSTATERELLDVLGFRDYRGDPPSTSTTTRVEWLTTGVRRRTWPGLSIPTPPEVPPPAEPTPDPAPAEDPETDPTTPGGAL